MTDVNIPLLRKAVEWAEAEAARPDLRQSQWYQPGVVTEASEIGRDCGTCYCIAGYVAMVAAGEAGHEDAIGTALNALGLDDAVGLFSASNTIEDVRRIAEEIAGESL